MQGRPLTATSVCPSTRGTSYVKTPSCRTSPLPAASTKTASTDTLAAPTATSSRASKVSWSGSDGGGVGGYEVDRWRGISPGSRM